jgi:archaellum component FlaC
MRAFLLSLLLVLPSCGYLQGLEQNKKLDVVSQALQDVDNELETLKRIQLEARAKADQDGDGKLSGLEKVNYLSLVLAGLAAEAGRRKAKALDEKHAASAENRKDLELQLAKLQAQLDAKA